MNKILTQTLAATLTAGLLAFSALGHARTLEETPSAAAMAGDALFARPVLFATTVVGSAIYLVSLPFSLLGGNAGEAGEVLVIRPAEATFVRCLGCTVSGRKPQEVEQDQ